MRLHTLIYRYMSVFPRSLSLSSRQAKDSISFLRVEIFRLLLNTPKRVHKRFAPDRDLVVNDIPVIEASLLIARVKPASVLANTLAIPLFASHESMLFRLQYLIKSIEMRATPFVDAEFLAWKGSHA